MPYTVKAVAALAGVSVRTLHHYDAIGLLKPAQVSDAGYRQYSDADLERLQQVLFFKELDFALPEIQAILDRPDFDRQRALTSHRALLVQKKQRLESLITAVDATLDGLERGTPVSKETMFEGFREEASQKWGKDVVDASYERRWNHMSEQERADFVQAGQDAIKHLATLMPLGPGAPEVQAFTARARQTITDYFYDCTLEIFGGLGEMYVDDPRFAKTYEDVQPGLAAFYRDAIRIYVAAESAR